MTIHRYLILIGLALLNLVAALRLWWPLEQPLAPVCSSPVGIDWRGRTSVLCLRPRQRLSAVTRRLGLPGCDSARPIHAGELVRLGPGCRARIGPMPGTMRLTLGLPIDLNHSSAEALRALPRIGPRLAARIIAHRRRHGPFPDVTTLQRVRGIGPRTVTRLRGLVTAHGSFHPLSK